MYLLWTGSVLALHLTSLVLAQSLTDAQIRAVRSRLEESAQRSWEVGTRAQVIIEYDADEYDVLSTNAHIPPDRDAPPALDTALQIAQTTVQNKPVNIKPLWNDGSAADPASLGVVVLLANWTGQDGQDYASAAAAQLDYLLNNAPRTPEGAISHREEKTQLWSDFVYMVPPFLAYYGAITDNTTLMDEAFNQISLYRDQLHDPDANNLWKHIVLGGSGEDHGHWATGNGWAAMGMLRVMGTYRASPRARDYQDKQNTLITWVEEIVEGMYSLTEDAPSSLFRNYPDDPDSFYDASSTALMSAVTYRLATLTEGGSVSRVSDAERARRELSRHAGDAGGHITGDGWLTPVVNPHNFPEQGSNSPEGQAFVVSMQAGYRAWNGAGQPGNSAGRAISGISTGMTVLALLLSLTLTWI